MWEFPPAGGNSHIRGRRGRTTPHSLVGSPPRASDPPATTFEYEAAGARAAVPDAAETGQRDASPPEKKAKKAKKAKKEKKEKKRGSKWAEA